jgi:hypothetical protein
MGEGGARNSTIDLTWSNMATLMQGTFFGAQVDFGGSVGSDHALIQVVASTPAHVSRAPDVTDLQGPPSECTPEEKLWDFKTRAQQYARDQRSCDDTRISYLEYVESEAEADWTLARMIAG